MKKYLNIHYYSYLILLFFFSVTLRADWVNVTNEINNLNIKALTATDGYIFAGNDQFTYRSSNNGNNWEQIYNLPSLCLSSNGNYIYRGYQNGYNYSTNYGVNWLFAGLNLKTISLFANGSNFYAGCSWPIPGSSTNRGVWISTNSGANWSQTSLNYIDVYSLSVSGSYLYAGGYNNGVAGGVFVSTDSGQSWTNPLLIGGDAIASNGNIIYTGVDGSPYGVYKSINYGQNWVQTSLNNVGVHSLIIYNNIVFAGATNGLYVSTNQGVTWLQRNEGMTSGSVSLTINNGYLFSGSSGQGVWRRPLSELVGINQISNTLPKEFTLGQNYPNPFNSTTKIRFSIPKNSIIKIKIFDLLGKIKDFPVNERLNPSEYEFTLDASNYSSGVYFYQLISDDIVIDTKKFIVIK